MLNNLSMIIWHHFQEVAALFLFIKWRHQFLKNEAIWSWKCPLLYSQYRRLELYGDIKEYAVIMRVDSRPGTMANFWNENSFMIVWHNAFQIGNVGRNVVAPRSFLW